MEFGLLPDQNENPFTSRKMIQYIPGDAIGVVVPNEDDLVEWMLWRLGLTDVADEVFSFESDAAKQRDIAVGMLPRSSCS